MYKSTNYLDKFLINTVDANVNISIFNNYPINNLTYLIYRHLFQF